MLADLNSKNLFDPPFLGAPAQQKSPIEERKEAMAGSPLQRAHYVERMLIETAEFEQAVATIEALIQRATGLDLPGGLCITGEGGTGKSFIREYFSAKYPIEETAIRTFCPVLAIQLAGTPTPRQLLIDLLSAAGYKSIRSGLTVKEINPILLRVLVECSVRLIVIDEAHYFIPSSGVRKNKERLGGELGDVAKNLYDRCKLPFVWSGKPGLGELFAEDEQLSSRWPGSIRLTEYKCDDTWRVLLAVIDEALPMEEMCDLGKKSLASSIHRITRGNFRRLKIYLSECVRLASLDGARSIAQEHFERAKYTLSL